MWRSSHPLHSLVLIKLSKVCHLNPSVILLARVCIGASTCVAPADRDLYLRKRMKIVMILYEWLDKYYDIGSSFPSLYVWMLWRGMTLHVLYLFNDAACCLIKGVSVLFYTWEEIFDRLWWPHLKWKPVLEIRRFLFMSGVGNIFVVWSVVTAASIYD